MQDPADLTTLEGTAPLDSNIPRRVLQFLQYQKGCGWDTETLWRWLPAAPTGPGPLERVEIEHFRRRGFTHTARRQIRRVAETLEETQLQSIEEQDHLLPLAAPLQGFEIAPEVG